MTFRKDFMTLKERRDELCCLIEKTLLPLIDNDYVLWGLPYHSNIGDILIWEGEENLLYKTGYKCLGRCSQLTCRFPKLPENVIILLEGGGDFGDVWRKVQEFRLEVIKRYPNNKIIIFPESVHYTDKKTLSADADIFGKHSNIIVCVRDNLSYELLTAYFKNRILLVPDMAFCIPVASLTPFRLPVQNKILLLKRNDKELGAFNIPTDVEMSNLDTGDWPSMENSTLTIKLLHFFSLCRSFSSNGILRYLFFSFFCFLEDRFSYYVLKPYLLRVGVNFVSKYKLIYTTRLHVLILSVILEKKVSFWDNSYGKNSTFYETWLSDLNEVQMIGKH